MPWTACVTQNPPPGAAGLVINQTHVFPDLYLTINVPQKNLYEAIDGQKNIAEIIEAVGETDPSIPQDFFEKLWQHDQVVFDTSKAR
jgi:hypothetical protein